MGSVDFHADDGDELGGLVGQDPSCAVVEVSQVAVLGVVAGGGPGGAHDVHAVVIVQGHHVLLVRDVAVDFGAQFLLHAFVDHATAEAVHGEAGVLAGSAFVGRRQHVVHDDAGAHEVGDVVVAEIDASATPLDVAAVNQGGAGEGQRTNLHEVVVHAGVHGHGGDVATTLAEDGTGNREGLGGQVVGFVGSGGAGAQVDDVVGQSGRRTDLRAGPAGCWCAA